MGTTLPAPLKPEHGWRENRGEKRQQLGAEPASSRSERLEKDRVCMVPWGSPCPAVPDALLAPLPSPRTAFSSLCYPRHSPNAVPCSPHSTRPARPDPSLDESERQQGEGGRGGWVVALTLQPAPSPLCSPSSSQPSSPAKGAGDSTARR